MDALEIYEQHWGKRWINLPNPGYGSWERTLYQFKDGLPPRAKGQQKIDALSVWTDMEMNRPECHAIYDAGSEGTRLYIYYKKNGRWTEEKGPEIDKINLADGLKDPNVLQNVVNLLDEFKSFDWTKECSGISSIQVLATGGMRLAENGDSAGSIALWKDLHSRLLKSYGKYVKPSDITVKTITGYEEGIYAWLAVRKRHEKHKLNTTDFGIAEMGGASSQVTFPCGINCTNARNIVIDQQEMKFSIHSFLKLGTGQLPESLGFKGISGECKWGNGLTSVFNEQACSKAIKAELVHDSNAIFDPTSKTFIKLPDRSHVAKWYLTGSFYYMDRELAKGKKSDVSNCCENQLGKLKGCYEQQKSCFVAIYRPLFLEALGIRHADPKNVMKAKISWTMGAVICNETDCLQKITTRQCPWLTSSACLIPPN